MSLKDKLLSPYVVGGAVAAGWYGHSKYGKKHGYAAPVVGALAGGVAGMLLQKWFGPKLPTAAEAQAQIAQQQQAQQVEGYDDYVDFDDPRPRISSTPPPKSYQQSRAEYEAEKAATMNLGSLSNGDGLGSLSVDDAFNADELDYSDLIGDDDDGGYHGRGVN